MQHVRFQQWKKSSFNITNQLDYEQHILDRFDYLENFNVPSIGYVVLRLVGFGVVNVIGFDPTEVAIGDIAVKVTHSGFLSKVYAWVKLQNGPRGWGLLHNPRADIISPHIWHRISASDYETITDVPRHVETSGSQNFPYLNIITYDFSYLVLRNWCKLETSYKHLAFHKNFSVGLCPDLDQKLYWQMEITDVEKNFKTSEYKILSPVREREPRNFDMCPH